MIHNITKEEYIVNPCRISSLAYWKAISYSLPKNVEVIHATDFNDKVESSDVEKYFRLIHDLKYIKKFEQNDYFIRTVDTKNEKELVAHILSVCYQAEYDTKFIDHLMCTKVHDPNLWVLAIEKNTMLPVGLGIADFDSEVKEGSLEWVQVMPQQRGFGIGTLLVSELLQRLKVKADFVTTSGQVTNKMNPEGLYRKCGFKGADIWYIIRK